MKVYYDFHNHTGLSPCADNEMTPNNIVNMASLLELDCIAITDHNSYLNVEAVIECAKDTDLIVIPGMEVETSEEIHVICLFANIPEIIEFGKIIEQRLNKIKNKVEVFGEQIIFDSEDNQIGTYENLLVTSTGIDIYELFQIIKNYDAIAIPAHIDRNSYSVISNLGFIPHDLDLNVVEFSRNADAESFLHKMKKFDKRNFKFIVSSDTHYLENMQEAKNYFEFDNKPTPSEIIAKLKSL